MQSIICSMYDSKQEVYLRPFFSPNEVSAMRGFSDLINKPSEDLPYHHPEDFSLFLVGTWSDVKGAIIGCSPKCLANGVDVKEPDPLPSDIKRNGGGAFRSPQAE